MSTVLILVAIVVCVVVGMVSIYNKLIRLIESVNNNKNQIDVQLDRRYKVYESLISVVKKYMDYEKTTLKEVVALRTKAQAAQTAGDEVSRIQAEEAISKIGSAINLVFEQYPDLKADKNALQLQEEIVNTENKLAFAKQAYNDSVEQYTVGRKLILPSFVVSMFSAKLLKDFVYWGISTEQRQQQETYKVQL
jgi:Uncharacterized conserved protein